MTSRREEESGSCELEELARGRYYCDLASHWLVVSIERLSRWPGIARIEVLRYQLKVNGDPRYHTLLWEEAGGAIGGRSALEDAVHRVNEYLGLNGFPTVTLPARKGEGSI